jgi:hypothetical protein
MKWPILGIGLLAVVHEAKLTGETGSAMLTIGTVRWTGKPLIWPTGFII